MQRREGRAYQGPDAGGSGCHNCAPIDCKLSLVGVVGHHEVEEAEGSQMQLSLDWQPMHVSCETKAAQREIHGA
jgi:hypothetical protein